MSKEFPQISSPTLLIDEKRCKANIERMADKARRHNLELRPHFKTHQSADIADWFRSYNTKAITVSSLTMAKYFARNGWKDITIAFPANIRAVDKINSLPNTLEKLTLLINESTPIKELGTQLNNEVHVFIEIDTGSHRTGVDPNDLNSLDSLVNQVMGMDQLEFSGFYSHPGHSYAARSRSEILEVHRYVLDIMSALRNRYEHTSEKLTICIGDTPCSSVADEFNSIDSISPGNFVFYDIMQSNIGSCQWNDIAVVLACPIVDKYDDRNEFIVHGGAVHLSKDRIENGDIHYGIPVRLKNEGWDKPLPDSYVKSLSQEHGIIKMSSQAYNSFNVGDLIGILPVHSCLTADLMGGYTSIQGNKFNHIRNS